jgi:hypothetical protein
VGATTLVMELVQGGERPLHAPRKSLRLQQRRERLGQQSTNEPGKRQRNDADVPNSPPKRQKVSEDGEDLPSHNTITDYNEMVLSSSAGAVLSFLIDEIVIMTYRHNPQDPLWSPKKSTCSTTIIFQCSTIFFLVWTFHHGL